MSIDYSSCSCILTFHNLRILCVGKVVAVFVSFFYKIEIVHRKFMLNCGLRLEVHGGGR